MVKIQGRNLSIIVLSVLLAGLLAACGSRGSQTELPAAEPAPAEEAAATKTDDGSSTTVENVQGDAESETENHSDAGGTDGDEHDEATEGQEDLVVQHGIPPEAAELENPVKADQVSIARGAELFQSTCAVCHGPSGAGDGPAAAGLDPKPANFSDGHVQDNTDGALFYVISEGTTGTAMPPWKATLGEEDRWHLVNFLRTLPDETGADETATPEDEHTDAETAEAAHVEGDDEAADEHVQEDDDDASDEHDETDEEHEDLVAAHDIPPEAAAVMNPVQAGDASVALGAELFATSCTVCHGDTGAGDGPAAAGLEPKPANFSDGHVQNNTDGSLFYVISEGTPGTAMPPWKAIITEEDRWHLVNFLRTLPEPE